MVFSWWVWVRLIFIMFSFCEKHVSPMAGELLSQRREKGPGHASSDSSENGQLSSSRCIGVRHGIGMFVMAPPYSVCVFRSSQSSAWTIHGSINVAGKAKGPGWNGPWSPCPKCCSEFIISNKSNKLGHFKAGNAATKFFDPKPSMCCFPVSCFLQLIFPRFKRIRQESIDGINCLHDLRQSSKSPIYHLSCGFLSYLGHATTPWFPSVSMGSMAAPRRSSAGTCRMWETRWCRSWWRNAPMKSWKPWPKKSGMVTESVLKSQEILRITRSLWFLTWFQPFTTFVFGVLGTSLSEDEKQDL